MKTCCYCNKLFEEDALRPYGPNAAFTCFPCAMSSPETEKIAEEQFHAQLDAAEAHAETTGGIAVFGEATGPRVVSIEELEELGGVGIFVPSSLTPNQSNPQLH